MNAFALGGLAVVIAVATPAALAQTPQRTTATYGDWTVRCEMSAGDEPKRTCEVVQAVTVQGQSGPIAQVAIGPQEEGARLVVQLPLAVWLPADVRISAGDAEIANAEFKRCFPQFCLAEAGLDGDAIETLRSQSGEGAVAFKDGGQRDISVPLSFSGFADAFAAMTAEMEDATE